MSDTLIPGSVSEGKSKKVKGKSKSESKKVDLFLLFTFYLLPFTFYLLPFTFFLYPTIFPHYSFSTIPCRTFEACYKIFQSEFQDEDSPFPADQRNREENRNREMKIWGFNIHLYTLLPFQ